jgi:hypothetical protein
VKAIWSGRFRRAAAPDLPVAISAIALLGLPVLLLVWLAGRQQRFQNASHQEPIGPPNQPLSE